MLHQLLMIRENKRISIMSGIFHNGGNMDKLILNLEEVCEYTGWKKTKAREILKRSNSPFTIRYGNRLCADRILLEDYIHRCAKYQIKI